MKQLAECRNIFRRIEDLEETRLEYREYLTIDRDAIDEEFYKHPTILCDIGEQVKLVTFYQMRIRRLCNQVESLLKKKIVRDYEGTGRLTREQISDNVETDSRYVQVKFMVDKSGYYLGLWEELKYACIERGSSLKHISNLMSNNQYPDARMKNTSGSVSGRTRGSKG